jgi:tetratricopeptide (TPR) repeat protein
MKTLFILAISLFSIAFAYAAEDPWKQSYKLESQGNFAEAIKALQPVLEQNRNHEFALTRSAWLHYLHKQYNTSVKQYESALKINPQSLDAKIGVMLPLMAQSRWNEAKKHGLEALKVAPYQYYAHIRVMACEEALQQWDTLFKHSNEIYRYYPADSTVVLYLARSASVVGKNDIALSAYSAVLQRAPDNLEAIRFMASQK